MRPGDSIIGIWEKNSYSYHELWLNPRSYLWILRYNTRIKNRHKPILFPLKNWYETKYNNYLQCIWLAYLTIPNRIPSIQQSGYRGKYFFSLNFETHLVILFLNLYYKKEKKYPGFWNWKNTLIEKLNCLKNRNCYNHTFLTWTLDKGPLIVLFFWTKAGVKNHLIAVRSHELHGSSRRSFNAVSSSCVTRIIAPATPRLFQALSTGSQSRTILSCVTGTLTNTLHDFILK